MELDYSATQGLRMRRGWGHLRRNAEYLIAIWSEQLRYDGDSLFYEELNADLGYDMRSVAIATWGDLTVYLHRYTLGERIAGYPAAAIGLANRFAQMEQPIPTLE